MRFPVLILEKLSYSYIHEEQPLDQCTDGHFVSQIVAGEVHSAGDFRFCRLGYVLPLRVLQVVEGQATGMDGVPDGLEERT